MAEKLTPQQAEAVRNRGGKLLVSAAAGSGKTKVLVDRLLSYLTDPVSPANLDEFLIITYTKAAAAELRGKIASKLTERIAQQPENYHLQQQLQRLYLTKISTVHAFCADLLREYAYKLDLAADFRVGDENECQELRDRAMDQVLEDAYSHIGEDEEFTAFVDTQGLGRNDSLVPTILMQIYDSARCNLNPESWLTQCENQTDLNGKTDAGETVWGKLLMDKLFRELDMELEAMEKCCQLVQEVAGWEKPAALLQSTVEQLRFLRDSQTWDQIVERKNVQYGTLTFSKKYGTLELAEQVKAVRNACKKNVTSLLAIFSDPSDRQMEDLRQTGAAVRGMVKLVRAFAERYDAQKQSRRILDFSDLEHKTLDLLRGKSRDHITAAAAEIGQRFREIMVDEYQDSNGVQDAIFAALTQERNNLFMVGDVKQSIYQFRLADPGIFLQKYNEYVPAEKAVPGQGRKVLLSSNFRSASAVIHAVNDVFSYCMSDNVGGLEYGEAEQLNEGIPHIDIPEPEVEFHAIEVGEEKYPEEANYTAGLIVNLLDGTHMVREGDHLRPITADDIVILLRSPGSAGHIFQKALEAHGIRCTTGGGLNPLSTEEIGTMRSILQTISNPRQDIPLIAAMTSPAFGFTADDLAVIRAKTPRLCFYDAVLASDLEKTKDFLEVLTVLRKEARLESLAQLIEKIYALTSIDSIYGAMADGEEKLLNLKIFYQMTADFEASGLKSLEQLLDHLDALDEKGMMTTGEQGKTGAVTIMSIHKSKGLEFPVVFLCNLSRSFNRENLKAQVMCHKDLGLGLSAVDSKNRIRYPTIAKRAICELSKSESLSEELRVLYVAMTRARDRLIMTYATGSLEKEIADLACRIGLGDKELLTGNVSCPGQWILMSALQRTEAGELFRLGGKPQDTRVSEIPWKIVVGDGSQISEVQDLQKKTAEFTISSTDDVSEKIAAGLAFHYPHSAATVTPSKQTVTQRKESFRELEAAENTRMQAQLPQNWRRASFLQKDTRGTTHGSAVHSVMQFIRYDRCLNDEAVKNEIQRLTEEQFITEDQASMVDYKKIARLFRSDLGKKLQTGQIIREFKFSLLDDASLYGEHLEGEKVLLQGVVDCALIEEDGITVIDYKTDRIHEEDLKTRSEFYRPQVNAYAEALSRIYQKPVKGKCLYFFCLDRFVNL